MPTPRRVRRSSRGTALAETGIIITLLIPLTFAVLDFAGILYAFQAMQNGVSQATRFAVTGNHGTDASGTALPRDARPERAQRRAHDAVVNQLAAREPLGVAAAAAEHAPGAEGDQVGRRAADVDQHALSDALRRMRRGRAPVGRGDLRPVRADLGRPAPARLAGEEAA